MFTQYFGNYLFEAGVLSAEQFKEALRLMKDKRARLGVLAIEAGFMTPSQVEETFTRQLQVDKKFGELARESGYLTDAQLEMLLTRQSSPFAVFSQVMIDSGTMSYAGLSEQLERYKKKCGLSNEGFKQFQEGDISPVLDRLLPGLQDLGLKGKVARAWFELFIRNVTRFISDSAALADAPAAPPADAVTASQTMTGTLSMTTSFSGGGDAMRFFAGLFAKTEFSSLDAMARDVLGEFLNCHNGIFTANALELGADLDIGVQSVTVGMPSVTDGMTPAGTFSVPFTLDTHTYQISAAF
jgi:CheY-specific phosphatase CheX